MCVVLFCFYSALMCCCVWRNKDTHNWPRSVCCGTNRASQHVLTGPSSKSTARSSPMSRSLTIWRASRSKRRLIHCSGCDGRIPLIFCSPQTVHLQLLLVFFVHCFGSLRKLSACEISRQAFLLSFLGSIPAQFFLQLWSKLNSEF